MADFQSKYSGNQVEGLLDLVANGEAGGGGGEGGGTITEAEITAMGFTKNLGTITEVKMNGVSKGTDGVIDLGNVITEHQDISGKQDEISDLETIREGASKGATALQSVPSEYVTDSELAAKGYATTAALNDKVDKVSGKGLSAEDFTSVLKAKLEGLSNYNDTEITNAVSSLQTQLNTLVSGNANDAINSFNEIIAFLDGVKDTQDLAGIIASIEQQIAGKMDSVTLAKVATSGSYNDLSNKPTIPSAVTESTVSGWGFTKNTGTYSKPSSGIPKTDLASAVQTSLGKADTAIQSIKTINGQSIVGSGNITIEGGGGSGKANYPFVNIRLFDEENVVTLEPNTYYFIEVLSVGPLSIQVNIELAQPQDTTIVNEYVFDIVGGPTLSISSDIIWLNDDIPSFNDRDNFIISIVDGLACYAKHI